MKPFNARGQTLVLFALTLLLLTLMVTMTLSIGMKAKEKMELKTAADAAAYSQAVATARAFNNISLMNRAMMSVTVAMTGVESLISWASFYRGALEAARQAYDVPKAQYGIIAGLNCPCAPTNAACARLCSCANQAIQDISDTQDDLSQADQDAQTIFDSLDQAAGAEARSLQIGTIHEKQLKVFERLRDKVLTRSSDPEIAKAIADELNLGGMFGDEVSALGAARNVNAQELGGGCGTAQGAACERRNRYLHFVWAAMGSRGHSFVTGRAGGAALIRNKIIQAMPPNELVSLENVGSGYFASSQTDSARPADSGAAYADDHGDVMVWFRRQQSPCPPAIPGTVEGWALVRSDDTSQDNDQHEWLGGGDDDPPGRHTMGDCTNCPGMWPAHMDYNQGGVADATNNFGQPKNYAVLQRDYNARPEFQADPWNLFFRFRFSSTDTTFDNRGIQLVSQGNMPISQAVALSAGIAYYRRVGAGWREPPNFLNPYWRATLVGANVDQPQDVPDVVSTLSGASSFAGDAARALAAQGYKAW